MDPSSTLPPWAESLGLAPHPEGGWFRETWRSGWTVPPEGLPAGYDAERAGCTSILFLLMPGERSRWHRVRGAELWLHQRGGPLILEDGGCAEAPAGSSAGTARIVGTDARRGQIPQVLVPPGHWQRARPGGDEPVLVGCVVTPGFDFDDFELYDAGEERRETP